MSRLSVKTDDLWLNGQITDLGRQALEIIITSSNRRIAMKLLDDLGIRGYSLNNFIANCRARLLDIKTLSEKSLCPDKL